MSAPAPRRVAMLTYSVRPRGGVVHALEVAEALAARGHMVELVALGRPGERMFRRTEVPVRLIGCPDLDGDFDARVRAMIEIYRDGLAAIAAKDGFDVVHAQDCLSANGALALRRAGLIDHVVRTVHHVDDFTSQCLIDCQHRSIVEPDRVLCVSAPWVTRLADAYGVHATPVPNGVDLTRFRPARDTAERDGDRAALQLSDRLVVLTVGGIEPRKGSLTLLEAFARLCRHVPEPDPLLLVVGGASFFDYRAEAGLFDARAAELGLGDRVRRLGVLPDAELERVYRAADVFAFPSVKEGFGLAALEALACGLPVVASDLDVFRTFLRDGHNALLVGAGDERALGAALVRLARDPGLAARLAQAGLGAAAEYGWDASARAHEAAYAAFLDDRLAA